MKPDSQHVIRLGSFVRLKDGRIGRVYSASRVETLDGELEPFKESDVALIEYSAEYSLIVNAVFNLARRVETLEESKE